MKKNKWKLFTVIAATVVVMFSIYGLWKLSNEKELRTQNESIKTQVKIELTKSDENIDMTVKEDQAYNYSYVPRSNDGVGTALVTNNNKTVIQTTGFEVGENSNFTSTIAISNLSDEKKEFMLVPIIDYKQQHIQLGGEKSNKLKFSIQPKGIIFIPFSIVNMEEGIHDVIFLVMKDSNRKDLDMDSRKATELTHILPIRTTAIVGDVKKKKLEYTKLSEMESNAPFEGSIVTKTKKLEPWIIEENLNKDVNYYINVGNQQDLKQDFAVMAFLNGEQIPINDDKNVIMGTLPANTMSRIKGKLNKQDVSNGVSNFTTIYVPKPYQGFESELEDYVEPTVNVGIQKQSE
ncbi:hypothetical protein COO03_21955 [Bacillus sp. AFS098217]|nr:MULTISPECIES: hypothetical protein [Bacillus]PEB50488.1 hypothetical protein COO03_21955 [Bacillus sp. AFS098217]PEU07416.1 hypothetical protein CN524_20680 [Bacillus sp. AFS019443]